MSKTSKMIAVVFGSEAEALKGLDDLKELNAQGVITLYFSAIAVKDNLDIVTMKELKGQGPTHTVKGMGIGSLIGLLGGPAGFGLGLFAGSMAGLLLDMGNAGVNQGFIDDVSEAMKRNSVTLLAEIDEEQEEPIDDVMKAHHGLIFRRLRKETAIDQLAREISLTIEALNQHRAAKIDTEIKEATKKLKMLQKHAQAKLTDAKREYHQKEAALNDQLHHAKESKKAKITEKKEALKDEYEAHYTKLKEASEAAEAVL